MGQTLERLYVEHVYGKGLPKRGKNVQKLSDFSDEKLSSLSHSQLVKLCKSLELEPPTKQLTKSIKSLKAGSNRDEEFKLPTECQKLFKSIRDSIYGGPKVDHSLWDGILKDCVGRDTIRGVDLNTFNYTLALEKRADDLKAYLKIIAEADLSVLSNNQQLALLMNGYNALTVNMMLTAMKEGKKIKSIRDLNTKEMKVWDMPAGKLAGNDTTLSDIEHKQLRRQWNEPRLHACIVCASVSCPDLRGEAFRGDDTLDQQMTEQMKGWLLNTRKGLCVRENGEVEMSSIFNWFSGDFRPSVIKFMMPYLSKELQQKMIAAKFKPKKHFMEYDWGMNMRMPEMKDAEEAKGSIE